MRRVRETLKRVWHALFRDRPYAYLGRVLVTFLPMSYRDRVRREFFTAKGPSGILADIVRAEINRQHYAARDERKLRWRSRELFWGAEPGKKWHELGRERYRDPDAYREEFLEPRRPLVLQIAALLAADSGYRTICEIGTGNGLFADHLSKELSPACRIIGLDLNREQILENRQTYRGATVEFIHGEVLEWVRQQGREGTIFVACETLEFFSQQELEEFFRSIRTSLERVAVGIFALNQPGWTLQTVSQPRGSTAYNHNFPYLLEQCRYRIVGQDVRRAGPYDRICLLAVAS